jgi:hypothetical protein
MGNQSPFMNFVLKRDLQKAIPHGTIYTPYFRTICGKEQPLFLINFIRNPKKHLEERENVGIGRETHHGCRYHCRI